TVSRFGRCIGTESRSGIGDPGFPWETGSRRPYRARRPPALRSEEAESSRALARVGPSVDPGEFDAPVRRAPGHGRVTGDRTGLAVALLLKPRRGDTFVDQVLTHRRGSRLRER